MDYIIYYNLKTKSKDRKEKGLFALFSVAESNFGVRISSSGLGCDLTSKN